MQSYQNRRGICHPKENKENLTNLAVNNKAPFAAWLVCNDEVILAVRKLILAVWQTKKEQ